jgi:hypothetical protein
MSSVVPGQEGEPMLWRTVRRWWRRRRTTNRLVHTSGQQEQVAEHRAARRRLLDEAQRQCGRDNGGAHRWYDGPTRLMPLTRQRAPLLTYAQQRGHRCRG